MRTEKALDSNNKYHDKHCEEKQQELNVIQQKQQNEQPLNQECQHLNVSKKRFRLTLHSKKRLHSALDDNNNNVSYSKKRLHSALDDNNNNNNNDGMAKMNYAEQPNRKKS